MLYNDSDDYFNTATREEDMPENCIFCGIINGALPSYPVYEDEHFLAILDISPAAAGHTVLITKEHAEDLFTLPDNCARQALPAAKAVAAALKQALGCDGVNVLQNNGTAAGQTVPHFHIHLIPRYESDGVSIKWKALKPTRGEFSEMAEKIKSEILLP